jgi:hypothetical protein
MKSLGKYSMGIGDRFGRQGVAQLQAMVQASKQDGVEITPVWNKSFREHSIIGTVPAAVRAEADAAVAFLGWKGSYFVDADHISLKNVDGFVAASDFFTLDVADFIKGGQALPEMDDAARLFVARHTGLCRPLTLPVLNRTVQMTPSQLEIAARKYLPAVREAGAIYRHILAAKRGVPFVAEVSMDETAEAQTPVELLVILAAIADEGIPAATIAPKFSGRFNKSVDFVGDIALFEREFEEDLAVVRYSVEHFGLPVSLKLSVHSGSDKFSLYAPIRMALKRFQAGLHLKTAGTTWLEELAGLAAAGGDGLAIAREIYAQAYGRQAEMCGPYATVIDIDPVKLPAPAAVMGWSSEQYVRALEHEPACPDFNPHLRQLLHVGYKTAAELGARFTGALEQYSALIATRVTDNLYRRHIRPMVGEAENTIDRPGLV